MDVRARRRNMDLEKLKRLRAQHPKIIRRLTVAGNPPSRIRVYLDMPTAGSEAYPHVIQNSVDMEIRLPAEYPTSPPQVYIMSPIWNPNVWDSGLVCIGPIWIPTEGLDLFTVKLIRLLAFDPKIVNPHSPANLAATKWYEDRRIHYPKAFPTLDTDVFLTSRDEPKPPKITWTDIR